MECSIFIETIYFEPLGHEVVIYPVLQQMAQLKEVQALHGKWNTIWTQKCLKAIGSKYNGFSFCFIIIIISLDY